MEVSNSSSRILAGLLEARTGQQLTLSRRWRIEAALKVVMRSRSITSLDQLIAALVAGRETSLADEVVEALLNNETYFFRDRASFDLLFKGAIDRLHRDQAHKRRLSIWCAGCSTGQEAYSLAMTFAEDGARWHGWKVDILATDISYSAITRAREGVYSQFEVQRGLPVVQMIRWFTEEPGTQWRISPKLRSTVQFEVHNLCDRAPGPGGFDVILCRNVLLYFSTDRRRQVFDRMADAIGPDGCLMLGAGETVIGHTGKFAPDPNRRGLYARVPDELAVEPKRSGVQR